MNILLGIALLSGSGWFILVLQARERLDIAHETVLPTVGLLTLVTVMIAAGILILLGKLQPF